MLSFISSTTQILVTTLLVILVSWYFYYLYCFTYWKRKGVPYKTPAFPAGNITNALLGKENIFVQLQDIYREFKVKGIKHAGLYFFNGPIYFPVDPELIKQVLITDFEHFVDRGVYFNEEKFPLTAHMFNMTGDRWKNMRTKLSPTFTSGKLKTMYKDIFLKNTQNLIGVTKNLANGDDVNVKRILNYFTADIISASAFGLDTKILNNPQSRMAEIVAKTFDPPIWLYIKAILEEGLQNPGNIFKAIQSNREIEDFFTNLTKDTVEYRDKNVVKRNDLMSLLLGVRDKSGLTMQEMVAQTFMFFLSGFETSSSTISFCLHELAHNPEIQDKLRQEIYTQIGRDVSKFEYDDLLKLPYLDKVVKETLRLYPVLGFLNRIVVKKYQVPGTDVVLDEGTPVLISMLGVQRDPDHFPDPMKFDPERFANKDNIIPGTYIPFGEGPRICIGMRYGLLQTKLGIASMISQYKFSPSEKTPRVVQFDKLSTTPTMAPKEGMFLKITKVQ